MATTQAHQDFREYKNPGSGGILDAWNMDIDLGGELHLVSGHANCSGHGESSSEDYLR